MISVTIDGKPVSVAEGATVLQAARQAGVEIPTLCDRGPDKPALTNLLGIYSSFSGKTVKEIEKEYTGKGYADFKKGLAGVVSVFLKDFQSKYNGISDNEALKIMANGAEKIRPLAEKKMLAIKEKMGIK